MIGVINYGSGNIYAIQNILRRLGSDFLIVENSKDLFLCDGVILPGVGDFDVCYSMLSNKSFYNDLLLRISNGMPILGICVGMHLLAVRSEEGRNNGLGLIQSEVVRFRKPPSLKAKSFRLPHMGWNSVHTQGSDELLDGVDLNEGFYFLHNYHFNVETKEAFLFSNHIYDFPVGVKVGNIYGLQFHPEKSHSNGLVIFNNFIKFVRNNVKA